MLKVFVSIMIISCVVSTPVEDIQALETTFAKNYNEGDYFAVANAFNPGALIIPPGGDSFLA